MKSQFVKIHSLQGNGKQPQQSPLSKEWSPVDGQPISPNDRPQGETPAPSSRIPQRPGRRGLLSNWHAGSFQRPHLAGMPGPRSVAEQETLKHEVVNGPITGPTRNSNGTRRTGHLGDANGVQVQNFANGQVQVWPRESGITSLAALQTKTEPEWPWGSPSKQNARPSSQPLPPAIGPAYAQSQPYNSPFAMPGLLSVPVPPGGYRGGPALLERPPEPPGKRPQGKKRKKRRVPIWARSRPKVGGHGLDMPARIRRRSHRDEPGIEGMGSCVLSQPGHCDKREAEAADTEHHESAHRRPPRVDFSHRCERHGKRSVPFLHKPRNALRVLTPARSAGHRGKCGCAGL